MIVLEKSGVVPRRYVLVIGNPKSEGSKLFHISKSELIQLSQAIDKIKKEERRKNNGES